VITAVDTSVLLDVFAADPAHLHSSQRALRRALQEGSLIMCEVVLAELRPCFPDRKSLAKTLKTLSIQYVPIPDESALLAGEIWAKYRAAGGKREHLIPDFLIAAHAKVTADRLLTRDRGFYRSWFRGLRILDPK